MNNDVNPVKFISGLYDCINGYFVLFAVSLYQCHGQDHIITNVSSYCAVSCTTH